MIAHFAEWLSNTPFSNTLQVNLWVIPVVQCIHILAFTVVIGSAFMIDLRILEIAGRSQTMTATARRFIPWLWCGVVVALVTGVLMIVGEPVRELVNPAFWTKMALLAVSLAAAGAFQATLNRRMAFWEETSPLRKTTRVLAVISLLIWMGILVLGRLIAYAQVNA
jgi:uncharacterized membrane protein